MRFTIAVIAVLALLTGCSVPGGAGSIAGTIAFEALPTTAQARSVFPRPAIAAGEVLISFYGDMDDTFSPPATVRSGGVTFTLHGQRSALGTYVYRAAALSEQETWSIIGELERSGVYATVMPNVLLEPLGVPIAPKDLWHYELINAVSESGAWNLGYTGAGVTVGVVDTGGTVSGGLEHTDLHFAGGYKFDGVRDADFTAVNHHGMHVAGTIGANGAVFQGLAPAVDLIAARTIGLNGRGAITDVFDAVWWAAGGSIAGVPDNPNPARVINISLGVDRQACPAAAASLFEMLHRAGVIVVVAAGNSGIPADQVMPANCPGVITVGALEPGGTQAPYSGYGEAVDVVAPGGLKSTDPEKKVFSTLIPDVMDQSTYGWEVGTSMAAPHVAGVIALMLEKNATLDTDAVLEILRDTAYEPASCNGCGAGGVDAKAALDATPASSDPPAFSPLPTRPNAFFPAFVVALKTCKIGTGGCTALSPQYAHGVAIDASRFVQVSQFTNLEPFDIPSVAAGEYHVLAWRPYRLSGLGSAGVPINVAPGDDIAIANHLVNVGRDREGRVNLVLGPYAQGDIDAMLVHAMTQVLSNGL